jgi:hypothetical protein
MLFSLVFDKARLNASNAASEKHDKQVLNDLQARLDPYGLKVYYSNDQANVVYIEQAPCKEVLAFKYETSDMDGITLGINAISGVNIDPPKWLKTPADVPAFAALICSGKSNDFPFNG